MYVYVQYNKFEMHSWYDSMCYFDQESYLQGKRFVQKVNSHRLLYMIDVNEDSEYQISLFC